MLMLSKRQPKWVIFAYNVNNNGWAEKRRDNPDRSAGHAKSVVDANAYIILSVLDFTNKKFPFPVAITRTCQDEREYSIKERMEKVKQSQSRVKCDNDEFKFEFFSPRNKWKESVLMVRTTNNLTFQTDNCWQDEFHNCESRPRSPLEACLRGYSQTLHS